MRVAFFSPLPPARSGISDYSAALVEALQPLAELETFSDESQAFDPSRFDITLYQIGNNGHHAFAYQAALRHPGVVAMHESNLHHLVADITIKRGDWEAYLEECEYNGGAAARAFGERVRRLETGPDYEGVKMTRRLLETARGVVVHSRFMEREMRAAGYAGPVAVIPHGAWIPEADGNAYRHKLGIDEVTPLVGIFGFLKPYKRIAESLRAFRRLTRLIPEARMILAGEPHPDLPLAPLIGSLDLSANVRVLGFTPAEDFVGYLAACDTVLNLRYPTVGESSGTLLRALGLGKATVVSDVGSFREFPDDVCLKAPAGAGEENAIFEYLNLLTSRPDVARALGARARDYVARECNWAAVARRYGEFLEAVSSGAVVGRAILPADSLSASPAACKAASFFDPANADDGNRSSAPSASGAGHRFLWPAISQRCADDKKEPSAPSDEPAGRGEGAEQTDRSRESEVRSEPPAPPGLAADPIPYLRTWAPNEESRRYVDVHQTRLAKTLEMIPPGGPGDRILEMGAYLHITPALQTRLGYGEVRGCYLGKLGRTDRRVAASSDGERFVCDIDHFDAEKDPFPYPDGYFSTVLCCELIEHLCEDPMHLMGEANRVLKPGGSLLLTTPNVAALRAIVAVLQGYHPGFFHGYIRPARPGEEVDARHNREYTPREIRKLLVNSGFEVVRLETGEFRDMPHPEYGWVMHLLERYRLETGLRGDGIYALGRKAGPVKERYPEWLYA